MSKVALTMILAGTEEPDNLKRCLNSIAKWVNAIYITITSPTPDDKLKEACREYGANVDYEPNKFFHTFTDKDVAWLKEKISIVNVKAGDKVFKFDEARNHNMAKVPKEYRWILWLDCDDVFRGGDKLKGLIKNAEESKAQSVFLNYLYQVEIVDNKIKNVLIEHLRERVIENTGVYKWIAPIHETLIEQVPTKKVENRDCDVLHLSSVKRFEKALQRNLRSLELSILQTKIKDPRPIYYLGKAYYDLYTQKSRDMKHLDAAKGLFETYLHGSSDQEYLNKSGWGEERSQCWEYLSEIYRQKTEYNNSIKCCMNALIEDERFPSIFLNIAMSYLLKKEWGRALWWVKLASNIPMPHTTLVSNPKDLQARTLEIVYHASLNSSMIDEAWAAAVKLKELLPENKEVEDRVSFTGELRQGRDLTKNLVGLAQHLDQTGQQELLKPLLLSAPRLIENNPIIANLRKNIIPPKIWGDNELCLYCGPAFTPWSPKQLDNPGECFVGGSEEAVIYLAKELSDLGWKVTVYAEPAANEGVHDGVTYLPYYKFNTKDEFNIVVAWRRPSFVDENIKAKKIYIWCHDICNQLDYTKERLEKIEKIIVLSPWHRSNIPKVPDEKVMITGNGVDLESMVMKGQQEDLKRNPYKCFYGSSYDRGLYHLLQMWPDVKKAVPQATLEIAYGWQLFVQFYRDNPASMGWKGEMDKLMQADGITHHNRLSQPDVVKLMKKCSIWVYPTHFGEISCINAMKSQVLGLIPVCTDFAALQTTVKFGKKIKGDIYDQETKDKYKTTLIEALTNEKWQEEVRPEMMKWAQAEFGWSKIAKQWTEEFKTDELKTAMDIILKECSSADKFMPVQLQKKYEYLTSY